MKIILLFLDFLHLATSSIQTFIKLLRIYNLFFQFGALNLSFSHKQFTQFIQLLESSFKFVFQHFSTEPDFFYLVNCKKLAKKLRKKETQKKMVCNKSKTRGNNFAFQKHTLLQFLKSLKSLKIRVC